MIKRYVTVCLLTVTLVACESAEQVEIAIPNADIDCSNTTCTAAAGSYGITVIYTRSGCDLNQTGFDHTATGIGQVTCTISGCTGLVTSWADADGDPISTMSSGAHDICGNIDFNNDSIQNSGDVSHDERENISSEVTRNLTAWSDF